MKSREVAEIEGETQAIVGFDSNMTFDTVVGLEADGTCIGLWAIQNEDLSLTGKLCLDTHPAFK